MPELPSKIAVPRPLIGFAILSIMLAWLYWPTFGWLVNKWGADEYYAHGPLLPFLSLYLIWQQRHALRQGWQNRPRFEWASLSILIGGLALQFVGTVVDVQFVQALSFPIVLLGVVRLVGGKRATQILRFPVLFLIMAVPLSGMLVQTVTVPLQNNAAACAAAVLGLFGMPIERVGVNLYTPHYNFVVAVACSGLKTTIMLLTMGMMIAHITPYLSRLARFLLSIITIPIALFANALRIIVIILIGHYFGIKAAEGFLHSLSGIFMFGVSLSLLLLLANVFVKSGWIEAEVSNLDSKNENTPDEIIQVNTLQRGFPSRWLSYGLVLALLLVTRYAGASAITTENSNTSTAQVIIPQLPTQIGNWQGKSVPVDKYVYEVLNPDAVTQMRYRLTHTSAILKEIGVSPNVEALVIYSRQWKNFHSPVMCLRAGGWEISDEQTREIRGFVQGHPQNLTLNLLTGERREGTTRLAYCFMDTDQQVRGWIPTMAKLAGARFLKRSSGIAEVQFGFDPRWVQSDGNLAPEISDLMLQIANQVQEKLRQNANTL